MIFPAPILSARCPFCGSTPHLPTCHLAGRRIRLSPAVRLVAPPLVDVRARDAFRRAG